MPFITIQLASRAQPTTRSQKAALVDGVTRLMVEVLGKTPESVNVVIEEHDSDNWGVGGELVSERRARRLQKGPMSA